MITILLMMIMIMITIMILLIIMIIIILIPGLEPGGATGRPARGASVGGVRGGYSPDPDLVLFRRSFPRVFLSGGEFVSHRSKSAT